MWPSTTQPIDSTRMPFSTRISGIPPSTLKRTPRQFAPQSQHATILSTLLLKLPSVRVRVQLIGHARNDM